jgi:hypothetical protein
MDIYLVILVQVVRGCEWETRGTGRLGREQFDEPVGHSGIVQITHGHLITNTK